MSSLLSFPRSGVGLPEYRSSGAGRRSVPNCVPTPKRGNDAIVFSIDAATIR